MNHRQIHSKLALINTRLFTISVGGDTVIWIHPYKTVKEWRKDIRAFQHFGDMEMNLYEHLRKLGYSEALDVVSDVYEGKIEIKKVGKSKRGTLVDDPIHEEQKSGFGHYGWENSLEE